MTPRVADVTWWSSVASDTRRPTVDRVSASAYPSRAEALAIVEERHAPEHCPGYQRPGTARERFRCPGCGTRYEHRAGRWQVLSEAP